VGVALGQSLAHSVDHFKRGFATMNPLVVVLLFVVAGVASSLTINGNSILRQSEYSLLAGHRVAVLSNPTGVFPTDMVHIVDDLHQISSNKTLNKHNIELVLIYGPERGFRGEKQAETGDELLYYDSVTGLPVMSAYSMSTAQLQSSFLEYNITAVLVDMQDVGVRLYTFIWTMYNVQLAFGSLAADASVTRQFVVCDRPNPNGGNFVDGPMLDMNFASGYGKVPIPFIHGMTIGELALLFNQQLAAPVANIEVIKMKNWSRNMSYYDTQLPWVPPSPNLPTVFSAVTYAATVFLEATTVSEGRGTCTPFTLFGAPFINAQTFAQEMNSALGCQAPHSAACFRGTYYQPTYQKYNGSVVQGAQYVEHLIGVNSKTPSLTLKGFRSATLLLQTLKRLSTPAESFKWDGSWFGHPGVELIDQYAGTDQYRLMLDGGQTVDEIVSYFSVATEKFKQTRQPFLLYV
jgi:uncharacterized protein YbbC (DUF1343 family)